MDLQSDQYGLRLYGWNIPPIRRKTPEYGSWLDKHTLCPGKSVLRFISKIQRYFYDLNTYLYLKDQLTSDINFNQWFFLTITPIPFHSVTNRAHGRIQFYNNGSSITLYSNCLLYENKLNTMKNIMYVQQYVGQIEAQESLLIK